MTVANFGILNLLIQKQSGLKSLELPINMIITYQILNKYGCCIWKLYIMNKRCKKINRQKTEKRIKIAGKTSPVSNCRETNKIEAAAQSQYWKH